MNCTSFVKLWHFLELTEISVLVARNSHISWDPLILLKKRKVKIQKQQAKCWHNGSKFKQNTFG